jgi:hypothetical protein
MDLEVILACFDSALAGRPFGCTIDPTPEGLRRAAKVADEIKRDRIPIGKAAAALRSALAMQRVEVFGVPNDRPMAAMMIEADRHMKQLALGQFPLPEPAKNYLDFVDAHLERGPPDQLLLRLWFTSRPRAVRCDGAHRVFEIAGTPIRLSGQNERAVASGERGVRADDIRTVQFVRDFNENWNAIRAKYPIYGALESIYRCASIAELICRYADPRLKQELVESLAIAASWSAGMPHAPRQVESIAMMHTARHGNVRHYVLLASGGVAVNPAALLMRATAYPALASLSQPAESQPRLIGRWWWDVEGGR